MNYTESSRHPKLRVRKDVGINENRMYSVTLAAKKDSYTFKNVKKFAKYSVMIAGYNDYGVGPYSEILEILTSEGGK